MHSTTPANATEVVETFLKEIKKDGEQFSAPEEYVMQYLVASLKQLCRNDDNAMQYIQRSTSFLQKSR